MQLGISWYVLAEHATLAAHSETWIADARQREDLYAYAAITTFGFGFLRHLMRDDPKAAQAEFREAMAPWPDEPVATHHFGTIIATVYTLSYQGGDAGLRWLEQNQARFKRAAILKNTVFEQSLCNLHVTAALAAMDASDATRNAELSASVSKQIQRLQKFSSPLSGPFTKLWISVLCALRGDRSEALTQAKSAHQGLSSVHKTYSIAALYWAGWLEAGSAGADKQASAIGTLQEQGWRAPERALAMLLPVFHLLKR
jgi:hypothetical protein